MIRIRSIGYSKSIKGLEKEARALGLAEPESKLAIARSYGFLTWRQAVVYLLVWSSAEREHEENGTPHLHRLACLGYSNDRADQYREAADRLAAQPSLGSADIWTAACTGDTEAVANHLDHEPALLEQRGGFFDWEPLLYAAYARIPGRSTLDVGRLILERGANADAHFYWGGAYRFTALTGVFGHGEGGPHNCPEHPDMEAFARLLLDSGARPDDGQALYNRMFADHDSVCLKLLLEYGLSKDATCNWRNVGPDGYLEDFTQQLLQYQLGWAVDKRLVERVRLLIEHGADLSTPNGQASFYERAALSGEAELAEHLVARGAERTELRPVDRLVAAIRAADEERVRSMLAADPKLRHELARYHPEIVHRAAAAGQLEAIRLCATVGIEVDRVTRNTPLHEAALNGRLEAVQLLLELGTDPKVLDTEHGATAAGWARHAGHSAIADFLDRVME